MLPNTFNSLTAEQENPEKTKILLKELTIQDPVRVCYTISRENREQLNHIAKNCGLPATALVNLSVQRFLQDVDDDKISITVPIKY